MESERNREVKRANVNELPESLHSKSHRDLKMESERTPECLAGGPEKKEGNFLALMPRGMPEGAENLRAKREGDGLKMQVARTCP